MIVWTIYLSFAGGVIVLLSPRALARWLALAIAVAGFVHALGAFFAWGTDFRHFATIVRLPWIPALGINYHLAADGVIRPPLSRRASTAMRA